MVSPRSTTYWIPFWGKSGLKVAAPPPGRVDAASPCHLLQGLLEAVRQTLDLGADFLPQFPALIRFRTNNLPPHAL